MLLNVIVQIAEGLDLLQVTYGDGNLVGHLHQGDEVYQIDAVELKGLLQVGIGGEFTLFYFKLVGEHAVYLLNDFFSCHHVNLQFKYLQFIIYFSIFNLHILHDQCRIGSSKAEGIAEEDVEVSLLGLGEHIDTGRLLIRILEIDITSNEVVLHHQHGVDNL